jgi:hypothetical protein
VNEMVQPGPGKIPAAFENYSSNSEMKWFDIWKKILLHPTVDTFIEVAEQSDRKKNTYILLAAAITLMSGAVSLGIYLGVTFLLPLYVQLMPEFAELLPRIPENFLLWVFPANCLSITCSFLIMIVIDYFLGRILGGIGTFKKTLFVYCSFYIPIVVINALIMFIPILNIAGTITGIYRYYLWAVGFKSVQNISWGKAILITVVLPIVIMLLYYGILNYVWMQHYMQNMMNVFTQSYPSHTY